MKTFAPGVVHAVPPDVAAVFTKDSDTAKRWENITPLARNEWLCFITEAKKEETRVKRIIRLQNDLSLGKNRPCCWAGCPHRVKTGS